MESTVRCRMRGEPEDTLDGGEWPAHGSYLDLSEADAAKYEALGVVERA